MYALVTGASSGIGLEIAKELDKKGYNIILAARNIKKLEEIKKELSNKAIVIQIDLSETNAALELYDKVKELEIERRNKYA